MHVLIADLFFFLYSEDEDEDLFPAATASKKKKSEADDDEDGAAPKEEKKVRLQKGGSPHPCRKGQGSVDRCSFCPSCRSLQSTSLFGDDDDDDEDDLNWLK